MIEVKGQIEFTVSHYVDQGEVVFLVNNARTSFFLVLIPALGEIT